MKQPGRLIGDRYELVEQIGSGGMATVWKALQHGAAGFRRPVAIKRIRRDYALKDEFVAMFVEEARVCADLMHPNIVQIYDFGLEAGHYYLVMEWVEGLNLAQFLQAMREQDILPPWHIIAAVAIESLRGLGSAHERRDAEGTLAPVYHRDVTPQNIIMGTNGIVKLSDFGLARAMDRSRMTAPNIVKGKVGYLAPEMTKGDKNPTVQTDIYALGVVTWQALAGRKLFPGANDIEIFVQASQSDIPPLDDIRPDVPRGFVTIIERALARDPEDRFRTARQMRRVIANLLRKYPQRPDPRVLARSVRQARRFLLYGSPSAPPPPPRASGN